MIINGKEYNDTIIIDENRIKIFFYHVLNLVIKKRVKDKDIMWLNNDRSLY